MHQSNAQKHWCLVSAPGDNSMEAVRGRRDVVDDLAVARLEVVPGPAGREVVDHLGAGKLANEGRRGYEACCPAMGLVMMDLGCSEALDTLVLDDLDLDLEGS